MRICSCRYPLADRLQPGLKALERSLPIASLDAQFHHPLVVLFPCIERCRRHPQRTLGARAASSGYRKTFPNIETGRPDATGLLNKADGKNRESENPEEISLLSGRTPHGCARTPGKRFETENRQRGEGGGTSVCEYDRNDKTPKGCPTESCVNERPPKLADWNMAPHMFLFPEPFSVRQT